MENMITRGIKYKGLRCLYGDDEVSIQSVISTIKDLTFKNRLIDEAKQYYAKIYKTHKSNIYYGNLYTSPACDFPYEYVIGDLEINDKFNMKKLKGVTGNLSSTFVKHFYGLEFVNGNIIIGHPNFFDNYYSVRLPLLKHCSNIHIFNSIIKDLPIEQTDTIKIKHSTVHNGALKIKKAKELVLVSTNIYDLTSLEDVDKLVIYNLDFDKLSLNASLKIKNIEVNNPEFKQGLIDFGVVNK